MSQEEMERKICQLVDGRRDEIIRVLRTLVQFPTPTGQETEGQKYMQSLYSELGLKVTALEADAAKIRRHKAYGDSGFGFKGRPNIIGILEGKPSARSLILNGHMDVVSPEPVAEWQYPPWEGKVAGNKLYGRGAWDMKSGLTASYFALKSVLDAGLKPEGTVMLQSVIEEESLSGGGTLACFLEGFTADGMIIPEPHMKITLAHPGILFFRVRVAGKPAHAGEAHTGINAIGKMNQVYQALVALDERRAEEQHYPLFEQNSGRSCHICIGTCRAGDWISTVAGWAELECRLSYLPGEDAAEVKDQVRQAVNEVSRNDSWLAQHPPELTWIGRWADAWEQNPDDPFVTAFQNTTDKVLASQAEIIGATWGMDTRHAMYFNMPAISFGPDGENIHGINECVDLDSVIDCTKILALFIVEWCGI
jgi:acetylornithine deacetylase